MKKGKYLDNNGLLTFLARLKEAFGSRASIEASRVAVDTYLLNVDCTNLAFDTELIVTDDNISSTLGMGVLGTMILGTPHAPSSRILGIGRLGDMVL